MLSLPAAACQSITPSSQEWNAVGVQCNLCLIRSCLPVLLQVLMPGPFTRAAACTATWTTRGQLDGTLLPSVTGHLTSRALVGESPAQGPSCSCLCTQPISHGLPGQHSATALQAISRSCMQTTCHTLPARACKPSVTALVSVKLAAPPSTHPLEALLC